MSRVEKDIQVLNLATLFTGIDAAGHGASLVYDVVHHVFACEIDKFARQSFLANNIIDEKDFYEDVRKLNAKKYRGLVDILVGGSPCQSFSIAGLRKGTDDERGGLIYEYVRVVSEVKAPVIVYENVKGILSIDNGRTIKEFIKALRGLGYHCHHEVLNSKHYGVPQNRERFFLVGFLDVKAYHAFFFAPKQPLTMQLKDVLEENVDKKYYLSEKMIAGFTRHRKRHESRGNGFKFSPTNGGGTAVCLTTKPGTRATDNFIKRIVPRTQGMNGNIYASDAISPTLTTNKGEGIKIAGSLNGKGHDYVNRVYDVNGLSPTLPTMQGGGQEPKIVAMRGRNPLNPTSRKAGEPTEQRLEVNKYGISNCLTCVQKDNLLSFKEEIRKLTPRECLRLQGFRDSFKIVVSDSQMYKQAGNSMTATVMKMIIERVKMAQSGVSNSGTLMDFL